jgi:hypothetical protein
VKAQDFEMVRKYAENWAEHLNHFELYEGRPPKD